MLKKVKEFCKKAKGAVMAVIVATGVSVLGVTAHADATTPTSMLDTGVTAIINDFAADIVPTVIALVGILVPVGLTLWAIGFGIKKGINFLQKKASKAI